VNDKNMQVRLIIDAPVLDSEYIGVHPCINTSSLKIKTEDMLNIIIPAMGHKPTIVHLP
jgi:Ala-tRNA(Pro) deacylase